MGARGKLGFVLPQHVIMPLSQHLLRATRSAFPRETYAAENAAHRDTTPNPLALAQNYGVLTGHCYFTEGTDRACAAHETPLRRSSVAALTRKQRMHPSSASMYRTWRFCAVHAAHFSRAASAPATLTPHRARGASTGTSGCVYTVSQHGLFGSPSSHPCGAMTHVHLSHAAPPGHSPRGRCTQTHAARCLACRPLPVPTTQSAPRARTRRRCTYRQARGASRCACAGWGRGSNQGHSAVVAPSRSGCCAGIAPHCTAPGCRNEDVWILIYLTVIQMPSRDEHKIHPDTRTAAAADPNDHPGATEKFPPRFIWEEQGVVLGAARNNTYPSTVVPAGLMRRSGYWKTVWRSGTSTRRARELKTPVVFQARKRLFAASPRSVFLCRTLCDIPVL